MLRLRPAMMAAVMGGLSYWEKIYTTETAALIGLWRGNETSGSVAVDSSPEKNNGAYTGVTLANAPGPDGVAVPLYDGTNDYNNIQSVGLAADFNGNEGTVLVWVRVANAGVWADGQIRRPVVISVGAMAYVYVEKSSTSGQLGWVYRDDPNTFSRTKASVSSTDWIPLGLTWSKSADAVRAYYAGIQEGAAFTGMGTWSGTPTVSVIGAGSIAPIRAWSGWIGAVALWKKALTPAQVLAVSTI